MDENDEWDGCACDAWCCEGCPEAGAIQRARKALYAELPEDEHDGIHDWVYRVIIRSATDTGGHDGQG